MYATASKGKYDVIEVFGCVPIDYKTKNFVNVVNNLMKDTGIDIVMDSVCGVYTEKSYKLLRNGGRYVSFGWQNITDFNMEEFNN